MTISSKSLPGHFVNQREGRRVWGARSPKCLCLPPLSGHLFDFSLQKKCHLCKSVCQGFQVKFEITAILKTPIKVLILQPQTLTLLHLKRMNSRDISQKLVEKLYGAVPAYQNKNIALRTFAIHDPVSIVPMCV